MADALVRAAGALLWRPAADGVPEVALVHRPKYDDWSLPKGKLEDGEHVLHAAVREVEEETGYRCALGRPLPPQHYVVDSGRPKEVSYWVARPLAGAFAPGSEVDQLAWLPLGDARRRLTHPRDREVLDGFAAGPSSTVPLILVRHAAALRRSTWAAEDELRPLSEEGSAQAAALVEVLRCFCPARVLTSDAVRCLETVRPFAAAYDLPLETEPLFSERGFEEAAEAALERATGLLAAERATVLCTHRQVLPDLLRRLTLGSSAAGARASGDADGAEHLPPAGFYVLHCAGGHVLTQESHTL